MSAEYLPDYYVRCPCCDTVYDPDITAVCWNCGTSKDLAKKAEPK